MASASTGQPPSAHDPASAGQRCAWPLFDLRVTTPLLTLRPAPDEHLVELARQAAGRMLAPEQAAFMGPWTQLPSPRFVLQFLQFHWGARASLSPDDWKLQFGVYPAGEDRPVGMVGADARAFPKVRSAGTGSWLLPEWRGRGLGKEARGALLHLLFAGLAAVEARSAAHPDNRASLGVSRSLGYAFDGHERAVLGGHEPVTYHRLLLTRDAWQRNRRADVTISGLDGCLPLLGLDGEQPAAPGALAVSMETPAEFFDRTKNDKQRSLRRLGHHAAKPDSAETTEHPQDAGGAQDATIRRARQPASNVASR